jgi:hypothetical protein
MPCALNLVNFHLVNVLHPVIAEIIFSHCSKRKTVALRQGLTIDFIGEKDLV